MARTLPTSGAAFLGPRREVAVVSCRVASQLNCVRRYLPPENLYRGLMRALRERQQEK